MAAGCGLIERPRTGIEHEAENTDHQYRCHQFGIGKAVAGIEDEVAKPGRDAEHFARHQHDPDNANGQPQAGQYMAEHARENDVPQRFPAGGREAIRKAEPARLQAAHAFSSVERIGHTAAKASMK